MELNRVVSVEEINNDPIITKIVETALPYPQIDRVVLFGSRARGDQTPTSDYDIAVFCKEVAGTFESLVHFTDEIEELDTLYKIDLTIVRPDTTPAFLSEIEKEGVVIMARDTKIKNYMMATMRLKEALAECGDDPSSLTRDGVIQRFEFCTELAWKACQDYLRDMGIVDINAPKPVLREAFSYGLISSDQSEIWLLILKDRNQTSHIYDENLAKEIYHRIKDSYIDAFSILADKFKELTEK